MNQMNSSFFSSHSHTMVTPKTEAKTEPLVYTLPGGATITTEIDPVTGIHKIKCDRCDKVVTLTTSGKLSRFITHRRTHFKSDATVSESDGTGSQAASESTGSSSASSVYSSHSRNSSLSDLASNLATTALNPPCPGVEVPWSPGSIWTTYPFHLHNRSQDLGWEPVSISSRQNCIRLRSDRCQFPESGGDGVPCLPCQTMKESREFESLQARAMEAKPHTPYDYLTHKQLQAVAATAVAENKKLRVKVCSFDFIYSHLR